MKRWLSTLTLCLLLAASAGLADTSRVDRVNHAGGSFVSRGGGQWQELNASGQVGFTFQETGRDATTIHLFDASRSVYLDLEIANKRVQYKDGNSSDFLTLYVITEVGTRAAAAQLDLSRVNRVLHNKGELSTPGGGTWHSFNADGSVAFTFRETGRDATTIHLFDASRGVYLDLDSARMKVMYKDGSGADFWALYTITGADASFGKSQRLRGAGSSPRRAAPPPPTPVADDPAPATGTSAEVEVKITNNSAKAVEIYQYVDEAHESLGDDIPRQSLSRVQISSGAQIHVFYEGEDDLHDCYNVSTTAQQVFTVTPADGSCDEELAEATEEVEEPRQWRNAILPWLGAEQPNPHSLKPREISEDSFGERIKYNGQSNRITGLDHFSRGYNILKMDPSDLRDKGTLRSARIFQVLGTNDFNYHLASLDLNAPNYVEIYPASLSEAIEIERTSFSDSSQTKSSGYTVSLGASVGGKGGEGKRTKGGGSAEGKVGSSRTESNISKKQKMMIRKEAFISKYWAVQVKQHLRLSREINALFHDPNQLRSEAQFRAFFERFGTHYPLATLMGGWARRDTTYSMSEVGQSVAKTLTVDVSANVPVKAVNVKAGVGYSQSSENSLNSGSSSRESRTYNSVSSQTDQFGLTLGPAGGDDNYAPVAAELRPIWEIVWPEMLGTWKKAPVEGDKYREVYEELTDALEIARIDQLRARMKNALDKYLNDKRSIPLDNEQWKPRVFQAYIEYVKVTKATDGAGDPEFYGTMRIGLGGKNCEKAAAAFQAAPTNITKVNEFVTCQLGSPTVNVWNKPGEDNETEVDEAETFKLASSAAEGLTVAVSPVPKQMRGPTGETYWAPDWKAALENKFMQFWLDIVEAEDGEDEDYPLTRRRSISLATVSNAKNKGTWRKTFKTKNDQAELEFVIEVYEREYSIKDNEEGIKIPTFGDLGLSGPAQFDSNGLPR